MNDELKMDLADCGSPERLLQVIFSHYPSLPKPIPLYDLAAAVGIIDFKILEADGFIGGLTADPEKNRGIILTKQGMPEKRKRFTVGHEMGHFVIPSHGYQRQCRKEDIEEYRRDTNYQRQEAEANRFSAGLLMPKGMFAEDMDRLGSADVLHIRRLGDLYNVSMEAAGNRYIELSHESCALIFSHGNVVRYVKPSRSFPRISVKKTAPLPAQCLTRNYNHIGTPSAWIEQFGGMWIDAEPGKRPTNVLEQTVAQANGFKITLLYIDGSARERDEEEEDLMARWSPSFR